MRNRSKLLLFITFLGVICAYSSHTRIFTLPQSSNSPEYSYFYYSTFLGGNSTDIANDIAMYTNDSCLIGGTTDSKDFPLLNPVDDELVGGENIYDAFISRISTNGELEYSTFLGGSGREDLKGVAVENDDSFYAIGSTRSVDFPVLNAYNDTYFGGLSDVFVTKFNSNGSLNFSTYFGGSDHEYAGNIDVDSLGYIYISGSTNSSDFPLLNNLSVLYTAPYQWEKHGFAARFNPDGSLNFSTYLPWMYVRDQALSSDGHWYVAGTDVLCRIPPDMNSYLTYQLGWSFYISSVETDAENKIYLIGTDYNSGMAIGIRKYDYMGDYGTRITFGGTIQDNGVDVSIDSNGNVFCVAETYSDDLPTVNSFCPVLTSSAESEYIRSDAYVMKLSPFDSNDNDESLLYSTYLGGSFGEHVQGIAIDSKGYCIVISGTSSEDYPIQNAYDSTRDSFDAAISKLMDPCEDLDNDTLPNLWEYRNGLNLNDSLDAEYDTDADGLTNREEYFAGTDLHDEDTDNDGWKDSVDPDPLSFMKPTGIIITVSSASLIGISTCILVYILYKKRKIHLRNKNVKL